MWMLVRSNECSMKTEHDLYIHAYCKFKPGVMPLSYNAGRKFKPGGEPSMYNAGRNTGYS